MHSIAFRQKLCVLTERLSHNTNVVVATRPQAVLYYYTMLKNNNNKILIFGLRKYYIY